ncbi:hypothetical protein [Duganella sp. BuS-21]|uniref:hypothetical protein n=1 Tax=Duganella sp. BuS-21 TaxID=2943848 RepID=UPI0035A638CC
MSGNNDILIIGGALLAYMYLKNTQQRVVYGSTGVPGKGAVPSMPGNVGSGAQQIAVGAVAGFLQSIVGGVRNNTQTTYFPSQVDPLDDYRGDILQEGVNTGYNVGDGEIDWMVG